MDGFAGTEAALSGGFSNIDAVVGGTATDTLTGLHAVATWEVDGSNRYESTNALAFAGFETLAGGNAADTFTLSGAQTGNLAGGAGTDRFQFLSDAALTGTLDGGAGADTLDYAAASTARQVTLTGLGSVDGFAGTETSISSGFTDVDALVGGAGDDTLTGHDATATWDVDGTNQYVSTNTLSFASFETLVGGSGADTFTVSGTQTATLRGAAGTDTFQVSEGAALTGTLDGGAETDTLTYAAASTARQVTLTGLGSVDGFVGTEAALSGGFSNIDAVVGSAGADTLTGLHAAATWEVDGSHRYTSTNTLSLTAFETLVGGSDVDTFMISGAPTADVRGGAGADQFAFANGAVLTGTIQGDAEADTLDYAAFTTAVTVNLATGTATQVTGGLSGIENVSGGAGDDQLSGDNQANLLIGGAGHDMLSGAAGDDTLIATALAGAVVDGGPGVDALGVQGTGADDTFQVLATQVTLGTAPADVVTYTAVEALTVSGLGGADTFVISGAQTADLEGGAGVDTFQVANGAVLTGTVDGGADTDTLDYAAATTARQVTLSGLGSVDGFAGTEAALSGGFTNMDALVGSAGDDTLTGRNATATWQLAGTTQYVSTNTLSLTAFENFTGGTGEDRFAVTVVPAGLLTGGAGTDALDFSNATGPVTIVMEGADATGFRGTGTVAFVGIDQATGSSATTDAIRDQTGIPGATFTANTFTAGGQTLTFAGFEDLIRNMVFTMAFGPVGDTTALDLTLQFNAATNTVQLVNSATAAVVSSQVLIDPTVDQVQIIGTAGANVLQISASVANAGLHLVFDARGGEDELVLSSYTSAQTLTLQGADADGFRGTGPVDFIGLERLTGTNAAGDILRDATGAATATWEVDGTNRYISAQTLQFAGFETLEGGSGADTFTVSGAQTENLSGGAGADQVVFSNGAVLSGTIDGGTDTDTIDYAAYTTARQVLLIGAGTVDGWAGTEAAASGGFTNVDALLGGTASDTLTGATPPRPPGTWTVPTST